MREPTTRQVLLAGAVFWTAAGAQAQAPAPAASPLDALPRSTLPEPAGIEVEVKPPAAPAAGLLATPLTPRRFDIEGVVSIPFDEVAALFTPLVGRSVTLGEVVERSQQATQLYQQRGYALSFFFVPQQDLRDGTVRVVAVEGHVQALQIDGDAGAAEPKLREIAERLRREKPLRRETFEHVTELLGRLPGLWLQAEVRLPTSTDGASTLLLKVRRKPYDLVVGLEARKPHPRAVLTGSVNDLIAPGSQLGASVLLSSARKDDYQALHYQQFVGERGWSVKGSLSRYRGDPDEQLGLESLLPRETRVNRAEIAASYPWFLSRSASWTLGLSLYGVDTRDTTRNPANGAYLSEDTRTRVLQAQVAHAQHQATRSRQASLTLSHGLRALGASAAYLSNVPGPGGAQPRQAGFCAPAGRGLAGRPLRQRPGHGRVAGAAVQPAPAAEQRKSVLWRQPLRARLRGRRSGGRFGLGPGAGTQQGLQGRWRLAAPVAALCAVGGRARAPAPGPAPATEAAIGEPGAAAQRPPALQPGHCRVQTHGRRFLVQSRPGLARQPALQLPIRRGLIRAEPIPE